MRPITMLMSQRRAETKQGEALQFNNCLGGYFSLLDDYGLKVIGKTAQNGTPSPENPIPIQCVKQGTQITCGNTITTPCDLYEGDIWYPMTGKVIKDKQSIIFDSSVKLTKNNGKEGDDNWLYYISVKHSKSWRGYCSHLISKIWGGQDGFSVNDSTSTIYIGCKNIGAASNTAASAKQRLAELGVELVYKLDTPIIEQYAPQPIFAPQGTVNVISTPIDIVPDLKATMLVRR